MNQTHSFTFIIGYRHKADRMNNLRRTLDWINGFSGVQIILVEQDKHSKISNLNLKCEHIFIKSNMPYNRSWAFNVGIKYSKSNIIIFSDSDLIMNPNDLIEGIKALQNYEMVSPYNSVLDLTQQESNLGLEQLLNINRPGRGENDNQKINISGGLSMFRKDAITRIGGWNENFWCWGGEDDYQTIKVKHLLTWTELKAKCYHLWHNREQPDMNLYQRNLQILKKSHELSKEEIIKEVKSQMQKIGMKNKCDNF
jgi:glycosyltransferase involved in cell wall biosynthesis